MKLLTGFTNRNSFDQSTVDWTAAGDLARDQKDWHGAVACYRKVLDLDPTLEHIWVQLGNCAKESGRPEEAGAAYRHALTIDPMNGDTHLQLGHLLKVQGNLTEAKASYLRALEINPDLDSARIEVSALEELSVPTPQSYQERDLHRRVIFECSDLVEYFLDNRLPTGIQRVQINIVKEALASEEFGKTVRVIFYSQNYRSWHEITHLDFLSLINAGQKLEAVSDEAWVAVRGQACVARRENTFRFVRNDTLINIGTSWWIVDYFLRIRNLQDQVDLKYIPFVHDCIPLVAPEHCAGNLTKEFAAWIDGVFLHADYFLANSKSTAADLTRFAGERGHKPPSVHVVQLDGDLAAGSQEAGEAPGEGELNESVRQVVAKLFQSNNIPFRRNETPRFALFVSTLESRKNHILAFTVWDHLIARLGLENTPYLICVGKRGWMFDAATAYLGGRPKLQHRVRFLSGVDDRSLSALYNLCEFTLYPSHYEGWGLPVTESLCHGKVPVVARVSSLPEAGGDFAVYFDPLNRGEAYASVERLVT